MAEAKLSNKMAMSRALGAAFLNHQVEQLERSVHGTSSPNWRDRRGPQSNGHAPVAARRGPNPSGVKVAARKQHQVPATEPKRRTDEEDRKEADVVVVDASVLVHALYKVKKWCKEGRQEVIIIPLEALNTLDLLKKGSTALAQRARAASRILEAQVGTNPRIRVQRDDAFVPWDKTNMKGEAGCPEWVRRILCCTQWEIDHVEEELNRKNPNPKVLLAVLSTTPNASPQVATIRLSDAGGETPLTPVPLPAPNQNKHAEPRSSGAIVASWASKVGIEILPVEPTLPGHGRSSDDEGGKRGAGSGGSNHNHHHHYTGRGRRGSAPPNALVERPPAVMAMMEMVAQPSKTVRLLARGEKLDPDS